MVPDTPTTEVPEDFGKAAPASAASATVVPDPKARIADRGCLRATNSGGKVAITKTKDNCGCSMDLSNMDEKHANDVGQLLMAVTRPQAAAETA